ncbi:MAG: hypothetical protein HQL35_15765 [Alphaproteobacteria bacterium]|nr:hypothetical protein [Alphaproteobacteria bacterium]
MFRFDVKCRCHTLAVAAFVLSSSPWGSSGAAELPGTWRTASNHEGCEFYSALHSDHAPASWSGECQNGHAQGDGVITYNTDLGITTLSGQFLDGVLEGDGTYETITLENEKPVPAHYKGEFRHGVPDGFGKLEVEGVYTYSGEFLQGRKHGSGNLQRGDESYLRGIFRNGEPYMVMIDDFGSPSFRYVGGMSNGKVHGFGVMSIDKELEYEGEFKDGSFHGHGVFRIKGGNTCEGEWKDNHLIGFGNGVKNGQPVFCIMESTNKVIFVDEKPDTSSN